MVSSLLNRRTLPVIFLDVEVWVYYDNLYETGHSKARNNWIIQMCQWPVFKMWLVHSFLVYLREKACRDVPEYIAVCLLSGGHWALLYVPRLFSHQFSVCVHACEWAGADARVHTCIDQRRMLGRQDLSLDRKPKHLARLAGQPTPGIWLPRSVEVTGTWSCT